MSARQLSVTSGLSPSYVSKVELGQCAPSLNAFARIAKTLGMTKEEILHVVVWEGQQLQGER